MVVGVCWRDKHDPDATGTILSYFRDNPAIINENVIF